MRCTFQIWKQTDQWVRADIRMGGRDPNLCDFNTNNHGIVIYFIVEFLLCFYYLKGINHLVLVILDGVCELETVLILITPLPEVSMQTWEELSILLVTETDHYYHVSFVNLFHNKNIDWVDIRNL